MENDGYNMPEKNYRIAESILKKLSDGSNNIIPYLVAIMLRILYSLFDILYSLLIRYAILVISNLCDTITYLYSSSFKRNKGYL